MDKKNNRRLVPQNDGETVEPMISIWIGNFFEPAYSSKEFFSEALRDILELGGNAINLDSKMWEDFYEFYENGNKSQYVAMQDFAISQADKIGLTHNFLAVYANGDNLFLNGIRDCPPRFGEQITGPTGSLLPIYNYLSPKTHKVMVQHVKGLLSAFGGHHTEITLNEKHGRPVQTMFTALPRPSFDEEGVAHYHNWLKSHYGTINALNASYQVAYQDFSDITPEDYWFRIEDFEWGDTPYPSEEDFLLDSVQLRKFADNQIYRTQLAVQFFKTIAPLYDAVEPPVLKWHIINQWQMYFSNTTRYWFYANMGVDPWLTAPYLDMQTIITLPADTESQPNPYVVSCETAMQRSLSNFQDFIGGLYLGRYIHNDIYASVAPTDSLATIAAGGGKGLHIYGYNGLDDGGVLYRMPPSFKRNVRIGVDWFKRLVPRLTNKLRRKDVAMVFPAGTMLFEAQYPGGVFSEHRLDLLGWYKALADMGLMIDILHPSQLTAETLSDYQAVIIPADSCYRLNRYPKAEETLSQYLTEGGRVFHGFPCEIMEFATGTKPEKHALTAFEYESELIIPQGSEICDYPSGNCLAAYNPGGKTAIAIRDHGKGVIVSIGFQYGYCIASKTMPVVPTAFGKKEVSPLRLMEKSIIASVCEKFGIKPLFPGQNGVEFAHFEEQSVAINHNSVPVTLDVSMADQDWQYDPGKDNTLMPGTAVAWTNSLFEDNVDDGLGTRLAIDQNRKQPKSNVSNA